MLQFHPTGLQDSVESSSSSQDSQQTIVDSQATEIITPSTSSQSGFGDSPNPKVTKKPRQDQNQKRDYWKEPFWYYRKDQDDDSDERSQEKCMINWNFC